MSRSNKFLVGPKVETTAKVHAQPHKLSMIGRRDELEKVLAANLAIADRAGSFVKKGCVLMLLSLCPSIGLFYFGMSMGDAAPNSGLARTLVLAGLLSVPVGPVIVAVLRSKTGRKFKDAYSGLELRAAQALLKNVPPDQEVDLEVRFGREWQIEGHSQTSKTMERKSLLGKKLPSDTEKTLTRSDMRLTIASPGRFRVMVETLRHLRQVTERRNRTEGGRRVNKKNYTTPILKCRTTIEDSTLDSELLRARLTELQPAKTELRWTNETPQELEIQFLYKEKFESAGSDCLTTATDGAALVGTVLSTLTGG